MIYEKILYNAGTCLHQIFSSILLKISGTPLFENSSFCNAILDQYSHAEFIISNVNSRVNSFELSNPLHTHK